MTGPKDRIRFVKVFADDRGAWIYRDGVALWRSSDTGELAFATVEPISWDPTVKALKAARQIGLDAPHRAYRNLRRAQVCLQEAMP